MSITFPPLKSLSQEDMEISQELPTPKNHICCLYVSENSDIVQLLQIFINNFSQLLLVVLVHELATKHTSNFKHRAKRKTF